MKKAIALISAFLLLAVLLCGCGSAESSQKTDTPAASQEAAPAETTQTAEPVQESAAEQEAEPTPNEETPAEEAPAEPPLPDGEYTVKFDTDSSMFHVNEAHEGKGILTVKDGAMSVHISLVSKSIVNLFPGTAEDAQKDGALWLNPTMDQVTYSDGMTEEVYGFDVPVEALDTDFALALIGTKGVWYDHTVSVSSPIEE